MRSPFQSGDRSISLRVDRKLFIALVTFERTEASTKHLAPDLQGAVGYLGVLGLDEDDVIDILSRGLKHEGLRLLEVHKIKVIEDVDDVDEIDDHLADNIRNFENDKFWTWGTLHCYHADGEA